MKVGLLIISHDGLGRALLETVTTTLGSCPLEVRLLSVSRNDDPDALGEQARQLGRSELGAETMAHGPITAEDHG